MFFCEKFMTKPLQGLAVLIILSGFGCKTHSPSSEVKVVGGYEAGPGQIPSAIQFLSCSGSKIGEYAYLTAAHCVLDKQSGELRSSLHKGQAFEVVHGIRKSSGKSYRLTVDAVAVHYTYVALAKELAGKSAKDKAYESAFDLAVILVKEPTPEIASAVISPTRVPIGSSVVVSGYGCEYWDDDPLNSDFGGSTVVSGSSNFGNDDRLKYDVRLVSQEDYQYARVEDERGPLSELKFKLCPGDSGGGAFTIQDRAKPYSQKELAGMRFNELVGVNSFISVATSAYSRLDKNARANPYDCIQSILNSQKRVSDRFGLVAVCDPK